MLKDRRKKNSEMVTLIEDLSTQIYNKIAQEYHSKPSEKTVEMFGVLEKKIDGIHSALYGFENSGGLIKKIDSIEEQTKKTNGRVNSLEGWKLYIGGGLAILTIIGLPMIYSLLKDVKELRESKITLNK